MVHLNGLAYVRRFQLPFLYTARTSFSFPLSYLHLESLSLCILSYLMFVQWFDNKMMEGTGCFLIFSLLTSSYIGSFSTYCKHNKFCIPCQIPLIVCMVIHCQPCIRRYRAPSWCQAASNSHDLHIKKWNAVLCLSFYCKLQVRVVVIDFVKLFLDFTCLDFAHDVILVWKMIIKNWLSLLRAPPTRMHLFFLKCDIVYFEYPPISESNLLSQPLAKFGAEGLYIANPSFWRYNPSCVDTKMLQLHNTVNRINVSLSTGGLL